MRHMSRVSLRLKCHRVGSAVCGASAGCGQEVEMVELRPGAGLGELDGPSVNGNSLPVSQVQIKPPEPREPLESLTPREAPELSEERAASDRAAAGISSEPPVELLEPAAEPGDMPDGFGDSLSETDWETTRYLAVSTQQDLRYARFVVSQIIGEPFRAVAPAAGADVVVVTRWALAALRRRAWRDAVLTGLLATGLVASVWGWTWIPVAVIAALAICVIAYEQWVRDVKVL